MGLLTLYAGLLLPWLGGALWLAFAESRFKTGSRCNRIRQAGYGFFLGYMVLFLAIIATEKLTGTTSWTGVMLFLTVFSLGGGLAMWLIPDPHTRKVSSSVPETPKAPGSTAGKILAVIVIAWMVIHLAFIAVDIFSQPLYPWDAWLAWVYRAKAWYMAGHMTTVVSPAQWAAAPVTALATDIYTIDAWMYPYFPSVIPYWSALSLGAWSETLVNLPVLLAGIAIGMALYGQCREYGLGITISLVCCYLMYSIPLLGTHLALAGYADIWMAGFTGLGFIAVIRALVIRAGEESDSHGRHMVLGLLMLALGILVKNEGAVWLLAALAMLILTTCRARVPILIVVTIAVVSLLGYSLGITDIKIPLLGTLGVVDGRLFIPFIGNFALEGHNVWQVYLDNFFLMGSWNLLWVLVLTSMVFSIKATSSLPARQTQRVGLAFLGIFMATQLFIFGLTDQGLWADSFTAINRLPLHFVPALLFTALMIMHVAAGATSSAGRDSPVENRAGVQRNWYLLQAGMLGTAVVVAGSLFYLTFDLPEDSTAAFDQPAAGFSFAFGDGHPEQEYMVVDDFANGYALLSSGPVSIQASAHPVLGYTWLPSGAPGESAFFWRQKGEADNVRRTDITATGEHLIDLSREADWQGEIIEFGFLVAGNQGESVKIGPATLEAYSIGIRLQLMWQAWTAFEQRSQQSINFLQGGDYRQVIPLPLLVITWLLIVVTILKLLSKSTYHRPLLVLSGVLFLAGWMLLDIRWTANGYRQATLMLQTQWPADNEQRLRNNLDGEIYQYVQHLKADVLGTEPARILIIGDENAIDYYLLRAKYHLLPHSVNVVGGFRKGLKPESAQYVIFFSPPEGTAKLPRIIRSWHKRLDEIDREDWGVVYRVDA